MQNGASRLYRVVWQLWHTPEFQLLVPGVCLSLTWEVFQSPFYADTFAVSWTMLAANRLHCTAGDAVILLMAFWLVALRWGRSWVHTARGLPWVVFLGTGLAYTVISEHVNVHIVYRWAYSRWMPAVGGIGLIPLLQWLVVPTLSVRLARRPL